MQFSSEQISNITYLYTTEQLSVYKISKQYNVHDNTIARVLRENNIEIRNNNFYKTKRCNDIFFDTIDSEEKAYWLGFIYADGCITRRKKTDAFEIKLSEKDKSHLEKLKNSLQSEHKIGTYVSSCGYNVGKTYCNLSIASQHLVDSLITKGVTYQKTHTLLFPKNHQVPQSLMNHFIRGYFDGDGSVYCLESNGVGAISFTGTKDMLEGILNELKQIIPTTSQIYKYKNKDVYDLKIGGYNYFKQCYEFLYNNATLYLERKKNKFEEILNLHDTK